MGSAAFYTSALLLSGFTGNSRKPPACDEFAAITDGSAPLEYKPDTGFKATMQKVGFMLLSTRIYVIFAKLIGLIVKAVGK